MGRRVPTLLMVALGLVLLSAAAKGLIDSPSGNAIEPADAAPPTVALTAAPTETVTTTPTPTSTSSTTAPPTNSSPTTTSTTTPTATTQPTAPPPPPPPTGDPWAPGTTWQWQLTGSIDQSIDVAVYDVDGFDTPAATVASLGNAGRQTICYISAGSWEDWRPDAGDFPGSIKGNNNGWPGEKWLDIRDLDVLRPIMEARLDMCAAKGFDAVEPDNIDGYANNTGFPLSASDQIAYNRFLADAAHARGLRIGLKNDLDQVAQLEPYFDFAVNEQCFQYNECDLLLPFITAGKAVFEVEYSGSTASFCPDANAMGFSSMKKRLDLDAWTSPCW